MITTNLPDYSAHDRVYRALRSRGATGWSDEGEYLAMMEIVAPALPAIVSGARPSVLELGSGAGNFSVMLASRGLNATGVDISPIAVAWANDRAVGTDAKFRVDNVVALESVSDATFDAVVDGHCLHCIVGDDRARCLEAVHRVLRPGGVFVMLTMCGAVLNERLSKVFDPLTGLIFTDGRPTRYIGSAEAITDEVARAGFVIDAVRVIARRSGDEQDDLVVYARRSA